MGIAVTTQPFCSSPIAYRLIEAPGLFTLFRHPSPRHPSLRAPLAGVSRFSSSRVEVNRILTKTFQALEVQKELKSGWQGVI